MAVKGRTGFGSTVVIFGAIILMAILSLVILMFD